MRLLIFLSCFALAHCAYFKIDEEDEDFTEYKGHLKPLGSVTRPIDVTLLDSLPGPLEFFDRYVKPSRPVLFRGAAKLFPSYDNWRNDTYLKEKYGNWKVAVEIGKKETRSGDGLETSFRKFLESYNTSDYYLVSDIMKPNPLIDELFLPKPLMCDELSSKIITNVMWFSSGGTTSVLHTDSFENLNCLFDGEKELFMAHKKHSKLIDLLENGAYSEVDVERADMRKFPKLARVPWYYAKMEPGDCLYIPHQWFHYVKSSRSRNLAVNMWWHFMLDLVDRQSCQRQQIQDGDLQFKPIADHIAHISTQESTLLTILSEFDNEKEPITKDRFFDCLFAAFSDGINFVSKDVSDRTFEVMDADGDGLVWYTDLYQIPFDKYSWIVRHLVGMDVSLDELGSSVYEEVEDEEERETAKDEL